MSHNKHTMLGIVAIAATLTACSNEVVAPAAVPNPAMRMSNGAPSGYHVTLNIIGVKKDKNPNMDQAAGNVIFVRLGSDGSAVTTKIMLSQSFDGSFEVLDKNGTDGTARFQLPAPGTYQIFARPLGTPGGKATLTTCAEDVAGNGIVTDEVCSTQNEVFVRGTAKSSFKNVTTNLTTIFIDPVLDAAAVAACGDTEVSLFDPCLENYFWKYDNQGLKVLQIRFYPE